MSAHYTNIAKLRQAKGLTQNQVAERIGCHLITYSRMERGIMRLTLPWAEKIAAALDASPADFIAGLYSEQDAARMIEGADAKEQVKNMQAEIGRLNAKISRLVTGAPDDVLLQVLKLGDGTVGQANALVDQMITAECEARGLNP